MRLSVLDLGPVPSDGDARQALQNMRELAALVDRLGYHRYWIAEHHGSARLAASAPEVLIAAVAAVTERIRVGAGAILLPYYSPLKVAEVFSTLTALYPNRIDLGIARGIGATPQHKQALRPGPAPSGLEEQILDVLAFLTDGFPEEHPFAGIAPTPVTGDIPEVWLLSTSVATAALAAELGLPFAYALFLQHEDVATALGTYRAQFTAEGWAPQPEAILAVEVVCADSGEMAVSLAFEAGDEVPQDSAGLLLGTPAEVAGRLSALAQELDVDEIMVSTLINDHEARLRSYTLLAEALPQK